MTGVAAVISTLGSTGGSVVTDTTLAVISGAATTGVTRFVELSSFAVLRERLSAPAKLPATGAVKLLPESATLRMGATISRADVAARLLTATTDGTAGRRSVVIAD